MTDSAPDGVVVARRRAFGFSCRKSYFMGADRVMQLRKRVPLAGVPESPGRPSAWTAVSFITRSPRPIKETAMRLKDRAVIITGAGRGYGAAITRRVNVRCSIGIFP